MSTLFRHFMRATKNRAKAVLRPIVRNNNLSQFLGYEVANVALAVQKSFENGHFEAAANHETWGALSMLFGSAALLGFDPEEKPEYMVWGGAGLALGGAFLVAAGYPVTGGALTVASMENVRGGRQMVRERIQRAKDEGARVPLTSRVTDVLSAPSIIYTAPVNAATKRGKKIGKFINERPFLTGAMIKAPLRLEFICKNAVQIPAEPINATIKTLIGLAWMIPGDGGIALNDKKFKARVMRWLGDRSAAPKVS